MSVSQDVLKMGSGGEREGSGREARFAGLT